VPLTSDDGLYQALEVELRKDATPLDCHELFERTAVRKHANSANRVSDYLGNMWRKGQLTRVAAGGDSRARWLYQLKKNQPKREAGVADDARQVLLARPQFSISEKGDYITIDLPLISITINVKK
jgi:hypothetical protein